MRCHAVAGTVHTPSPLSTLCCTRNTTWASNVPFDSTLRAGWPILVRTNFSRSLYAIWLNALRLSLRSALR